MIKELKLSNFRLFDNEVTVRFRPITILIGKNNAGKSSIIKFLLMLQQSVGRTGFLVTNGEQTTLGSFSKLKNKKSKKQHLTFSLEVGENSSPSGLLWNYLTENKLYSPDKQRSCKVQATVAYNKKNQFLGKEQKITFSSGEKKIIERVSKISPNSAFLRFEDRGTKKSSMDNQTQDFIERTCIDNLQNDIGGLQHLSAMRKELKGEFGKYSQPPRKYVGKEGENTIFELWHEDILSQKDKRDFLTKHTKQVLGIDNIKFTELNELAACDGENTTTKARVNISDFGFGVSQCLPIFVQGLLMPPRTHLIVEQPEAQVHPTAQIEMGSFFVDLWKKYEVGSIIETHSDNILLRISNHIAKGDISPDDISISYFTSKGKTPRVENLDVHGDGDIQGLPMEFFGGDLVEILEGMNSTESDE